MIFLDTDILSYYLAGNLNIKEHIRESLEAGEEIAMTFVNLYEILKGLRYRNNLSKEKQLMVFLRSVLIFNINGAALIEAADIYAESKKHGKPTGDADILIAAIVISNGGLLVSNNIKHYEHMKNLRLTNWI